MLMLHWILSDFNPGSCIIRGSGRRPRRVQKRSHEVNLFKILNLLNMLTGRSCFLTKLINNTENWRIWLHGRPDYQLITVHNVTLTSHWWQCLKWSARRVEGLSWRWAIKRPEDTMGVGWGWGIFEMCPLKWCILVFFHTILHCQLTQCRGGGHWDMRKANNWGGDWAPCAPTPHFNHWLVDMKFKEKCESLMKGCRN